LLQGFRDFKGGYERLSVEWLETISTVKSHFKYLALSNR
jgi:hypothetical protein